MLANKKVWMQQKVIRIQELRRQGYLEMKLVKGLLMQIKVQAELKKLLQIGKLTLFLNLNEL